MTDPNQPLSEAVFRCFDDAVYWAPGLMLLTPVVAYDLLMVSNRFAGPAFRLRREMKRLINNESIEPLSFRDGDYWMEMADDFNLLRDELLEFRRAQSAAGSERSNMEGIPRRPQLFTEDTDGQESRFDFLIGSQR